MSKIHSTAIIGENCTVGNNVEIGAHSIILDNVKIGDGTIIHPFVHISGNTDIGKKILSSNFVQLVHLLKI